MTNSQRLAIVRAHFRWWLSQTVGQTGDLSSEAPAILSESILIADGFYAGRTFEAAQFRATWFMEQDELKIRDSDRSVVAVFRGDEITADHEVISREISVVSPSVEVAAEESEAQEQHAIPQERDEPIHGEQAEEDTLPSSIPMPGISTPAAQQPAKSGQNGNDLDEGDQKLPKAA